jgi:hypothetical protein
MYSVFNVLQDRPYPLPKQTLCPTELSIVFSNFAAALTLRIA